MQVMMTMNYITILAILVCVVQISCTHPDELTEENHAIRKRAKRYPGSEGQLLVGKLLINYDDTQLPGYGKKQPTAVQVGFYILGFKFLDFDDFEALIYLRQSWTDERLKFKPFNGKKESKVQLQTDLRERIWTPDIFIRDAKEIKDHRIPSKNVHLMLSNTGSLWYVQKLTIRSSCRNKNSGTYPMDTKTCDMHIESFSYTMEDINIVPMNVAAEVKPDLAITGWTFKGTKVMDCSQNYTTTVYPCLLFSATLSRRVGHYIYKIYAPSALLVALSWLPLWMGAGHDLINRLMLGLASQLGLLFLGGSAYEDLAPVYYMTAMHIWMGFCHVLVFLTIIKTVLLDKVSQSQPVRESESEKLRIGDSSGNRAGSNVKVNKFCENLDMICRIAFPAIYAVFNLIYWIVYRCIL